MHLDYVQQTIGRTLRSVCMAAAIFAAAAVATNTAHAQFTDISAGLTGVHHGPSLWGDDDNDGDLDLFINGQHTLTSLFCDVYRNAPIGTFTAAGTGLPVTYAGTGLTGQAWGDYDNDGDLDLFISGAGLTGYVAQVYQNTGTGYTLAATLTTGEFYYSAQWGDYDNDGDLDLLCGGGAYRSAIYRNDGGSTFTNIGASFLNGQRGSAAWGDYDNDGDLDVIVTGHIPNLQQPYTRLYRNDGGAFVYVSTASFQGVGHSAVAWGDYDNDGDLDVALSGIGTDAFIPGETRHLMVYRNNGTGTFTLAWTAPQGVAKGSLAWGDYNNDGNLDLLVTGEEHTFVYTPVARVYKGNGGGVFTDIGAGLTGVDEGRASWGDYDNDGRLDILLAGEDAGGTSIAKVYHNTGVFAANTVPAAPGGLSVLTTAHSIKATWAPSTDAETPSTTLSYNIYIKRSGGPYSPAPMADVSSGWRRVPELGNAQLVTSRTIGGLTPGATYDVCVQAIDQAYAGSAFACTTSVTLPANESDVMIHDCPGDVGAEPNLACGGCYWNSSDIYIRNTNDGLINTTDQTPISGGASNWVYVKLKNLSATTSSTGRVYVYFAKASAGLAWQTNWVNDIRSGVVYGNLVGYYDVTLPPSGSTTAEVEWANVPDPSDFGDPDAHHFCLLARYVSWDDPMTFPEVTNQITNTRENNNIAWRNVTVIDGDGPLAAPLDIHNVRLVGVIGRIDFNVPQEEIQNSVLNHGTVTVDLGADLYQRWLDGGAVGVGVRKASQEQGNTEIIIESANASIANITFKEEETFTMHVKIALSANDPGPPGTVYHWDVVQYDDQQTDAIGGERYEIHAPGNAGGEGAGKKGVTGASELAQALRLSASPNPTNGSTLIAYTLPTESAVTLSIFDAAGRPVRALVENETKAAGKHTTTWDGTGRDGRRVPAGTYFYRVNTANGSAEAQIKIVR